MKNNLILAWALTCLSSSATAQTVVTIDFNLGILSNATGTAVPDGSLVLLVGSTTGTFATPTATSFIGGSSNEAVLWQGAFDHSTGAPPTLGAMSSTTGLFTLPSPIVSGSKIDVYWYPTLSSTATAPGAGIEFGLYGWSTSDSSWVVPSGGSLVTLDFLTASLGGSLPDTAGRATFSTAAIPEPATYAFGAGLLGLAFVSWRRFRNQRHLQRGSSPVGFWW